jgi:membrane associated rhomboid family serine protease
MPDPIFTFAFVVATLMGALFHLVVGGEARRLALFLLAGWLGFAMGQVLGNSLDIQLFMIGEIRMVAATMGAVFALFVAYIFTSDRSRRRTTR